MANNQWVGGQAAVAQYDTLTIAGTIAATNTVSVTISTATVTYTVTAVDVAASSPAISVATNLVTLLASPTVAPFFRDVTYTVDPVTAGQINAVSAVAGTPFIESVSSTGGGATITLANVTAATGPNDINNALNWSLGTVPSATNAIIVSGGPNIMFGFGSLAASALASIGIKGSYQGGQIGLPYWNPAGYVEYRQRFWKIGNAIPIIIGEGLGTGPTAVYLQCATSPFALNLTALGTGTPTAPTSGTSGSTAVTTPAANVISSASGTIYQTAGSVGIAADDDTTTGTVTTVTTIGGTFVSGLLGTVTTLNNDGCNVTAYGPVGTLVQGGAGGQQNGSTILFNATTMAAISTFLGTTDYRGGGTITLLTVQTTSGPQNVPTITFANSPAAVTITNGTVLGAAVFFDPNNLTTWSNPLQFDEASKDASTFGTKYHLQKS